MRPSPFPPIYAITPPAGSAAEIAVAAGVLLEAGIRAIQIRQKGLADKELLRAVRSVREPALGRRAMLLVNDRADIARIAACGVHLGQDDLPAAKARVLLGTEAVIGVSTHDEAAAGRAFADPSVDYVAFGPIFDSPTKTGVGARGLDALAAVARLKTRPLVAIGGIELSTLPAVWEAGADSAAMISALAGPSMADRAREAVDLGRRHLGPRKIWIVGFMACGKTTLGRIVSRRLGLPFVDLDEEIERVSGKTVRALFESEGEVEFRRREREFVNGAAELPCAVVAAGGGTFASEENRRRMLASGACIFLDVPFPVIVERLSGKTDRPLFQNEEQARALLDDRRESYKMAGLQIDLTGEEAPEEAASRLLEALDERTCVI